MPLCHLVSFCLIVSTPSSIFLFVRPFSLPKILDISQLIPSPHSVLCFTKPLSCLFIRSVARSMFLAAISAFVSFTLSWCSSCRVFYFLCSLLCWLQWNCVSSLFPHVVFSSSSVSSALFFSFIASSYNFHISFALLFLCVLMKTFPNRPMRCTHLPIFSVFFCQN